MAKLIPDGISHFKSFYIELLVLLIFGIGLSLSGASAFTTTLVSENNTSDGFKVLKKREQWNKKLVEIAALSDYDEHSLSKIISLASATPELVSIAEAADEEGGQFNNLQSNIVTAVDNSTIIKPSFAIPPGIAAEGGVGRYVVAQGETISEIASRYGLSPEAILIANNINETAYIKPGQELIIPAVNGLIYAPKPEDTLEGLLSKFKLKEENIDDLLNTNEVETFEDLVALPQIVIPQDSLTLPKELQKSKTLYTIRTNERGRLTLSTASAPSNLAGGSGSMIWPTTSRAINQGFSRRHNGIDISGLRQNPGPQIFASDDGFVEMAGWQAGGWGNTVVINHGNGFKTRYAHMATIDVVAGQTVSQGAILGRIGSTGRSTGPHLHFTIYKNGVGVSPLLYVKP